MLSDTYATDSSSVLVSSLCMNCWDDTNSSRGFRRVVTIRYGGVTSCRKSTTNRRGASGDGVIGHSMNRVEQKGWMHRERKRESESGGERESEKVEIRCSTAHHTRLRD